MATPSLSIGMSLALGRASRSDIAALAGHTGVAARAVADGRVDATIEALEAVLEDIRDLSVLGVVAEPGVRYEINDPSDADLLSEKATVSVTLTIPTSPAHLAALRTWASRPSNAAPVLFERELRLALLKIA